MGKAFSVQKFPARKKTPVIPQQSHRPKLSPAHFFSPMPKIENYLERTSITISSENTRTNATAVSLNFLQAVLGGGKKKRERGGEIFTIVLMQKRAISKEITFNTM